MSQGKTASKRCSVHRWSILWIVHRRRDKGNITLTLNFKEGHIDRSYRVRIGANQTAKHLHATTIDRHRARLHCQQDHWHHWHHWQECFRNRNWRVPTDHSMLDDNSDLLARDQSQSITFYDTKHDEQWPENLRNHPFHPHDGHPQSSISQGREMR